MMKTALSLILATLMTTSATAPATNAIENKSETRTVAGSVYAIDYPTETRDYAITTIETSDGNLWDIEDYVAPRSVKLAVTFDTKGTETILDDEIVQIVTVWNA
jgi:hypothetical protein